MRTNLMKWLLLSLIVPTVCRCAGLPLESAGVRFGFPAQDAPAFRQAEVFADFNLPWRTELGTNWLVQTRLDVSAGWLGENGGDAFIASAGPLAVLQRKDFPVTLELGSSPTVLSRDKFPARDFGIPFQFTSYLGVDWNVSRHVRLGYRFQHMSNAHLGSPNPGLNMNVITASYSF